MGSTYSFKTFAYTFIFVTIMWSKYLIVLGLLNKERRFSILLVLLSLNSLPLAFFKRKLKKFPYLAIITV